MHDWNRSRMAVIGLAQLVRMPKWRSAARALACLPPDRHVRRCVVSVSALSSPSCVLTLPIGDRMQTPTAFLGRIPCECGSGWRYGALPCLGSLPLARSAVG